MEIDVGVVGKIYCSYVWPECVMYEAAVTSHNTEDGIVLPTDRGINTRRKHGTKKKKIIREKSSVTKLGTTDFKYPTK